MASLRSASASSKLRLLSLVFLAAVPSAARADPPDRMTISLPSVLTCTREKDHLVCIVPLPAAREPAPREPPAPKPAPQLKAKKWSDDPDARPAPESVAELKAADRNIALARSLLRTSSSPEERVLASQLLYHAREQRKAAEAVMRTDKPEPAAPKLTADEAAWMLVCGDSQTKECLEAHQALVDAANARRALAAGPKAKAKPAQAAPVATIAPSAPTSDIPPRLLETRAF
jgi:hypothetical protein